MKIKCPFYSAFGKWIECPHLTRKDHSGQCAGEEQIGAGTSWCADMIGKAMMAHKTWIGNDY